MCFGSFVAATAMSKIIVMLIGCGLGSCLLTGSRYKGGALGGLLSTCSNDLAFGLPLVRALEPDLTLYVVSEWCTHSMRAADTLTSLPARLPTC